MTTWPGSMRVAGDERVGRDRAERGAAEVEAVRAGVAADELGQDRELAAGDLDAGLLGAGLQALGDLRERGGVGLLDGEVVEHRDRLGADADEVVDVHRDAVDADRVQAPGLLGDDELGADAVGAQRDRQVGRDAQHAGVVPGAEQRAARRGRDRSCAGRRRARARPRRWWRSRLRRRRRRPRASGIEPSAGVGAGLASRRPWRRLSGLRAAGPRSSSSRWSRWPCAAGPAGAAVRKLVVTGPSTVRVGQEVRFPTTGLRPRRADHGEPRADDQPRRQLLRDRRHHARPRRREAARRILHWRWPSYYFNGPRAGEVEERRAGRRARADAATSPAGARSCGCTGGELGVRAAVGAGDRRAAAGGSPRARARRRRGLAGDGGRRHRAGQGAPGAAPAGARRAGAVSRRVGARRQPAHRARSDVHGRGGGRLAAAAPRLLRPARCASATRATRSSACSSTRGGAGGEDIVVGVYGPGGAPLAAGRAPYAQAPALTLADPAGTAVARSEPLDEHSVTHRDPGRRAGAAHAAHRVCLLARHAGVDRPAALVERGRRLSPDRPG